ncbi:MAG: ABC transporter permease subunit [Bauldia sp.]|nr:ABC transporter permease subunit [Bauldia sp.]
MNRLPGIIVLVAVVALVGAALVGLAEAGGSGGSFGRTAYVARLVWMGFVQAGLSALLSVVLGAAIALALARRPAFFGRGVLVTALNVATVLPAIVTVFAVVAVFGRSGWIGDLFRALGLGYGSWIYGLQGILVAHVFFNAPLAARVFLAALSAISPEQWRIAAQLGMPPGAVFRLIDWPVLRREAPGIAALIFLACFTSLAVVLALGGGPGNATLEVAIFEALRFEADFRGAAVLALLQLGICAVIVAPLVFFLGRRPPEAMSTGVFAERPDRASRATRWIDRVVLSVSAALVGAPLAAVAVAGIASLGALRDPAVPRALVASLAIGLPAGLLSALLALALATLGRSLRAKAGRRLADGIGLVAILMLVVSPLALSAGLFVVLRPLVDPFSVALPLIVLVNALVALPFTYRQIEPPLLVAGERYGNLADSLRLRGLARLRIVDWPLLRGPLIVAIAMATALSLGDLGVAAFFGGSRFATLPVLLYERLGAYRLDDAAAVALLLTLLTLVLFVIAQRWSNGGWIARPR